MRLFIALVSFFCAGVAIADNGLINGRIAKEGEWPMTIYIRSGNSACSASIVGERTILTAAHCVPNNGTIQPRDRRFVEFSVGQVQFKATCQQAPAYYDNNHRTDMDLALCVADKPLPAPYAQIDSKGVEKGDVVTIMGYGCTSSTGQGGNDGYLRVGEAKVTHLAPNADVHTFQIEGDTTVCFGDSGGPTFAKGDGFYQIGVNSRGDIKRIGLQASTFTDGARSWMQSFADKYSVAICGINKDCGGREEPKPEPGKPWCSDELSKVEQLQKALGDALFGLRGCFEGNK